MSSALCLCVSCAVVSRQHRGAGRRSKDTCPKHSQTNMRNIILCHRTTHTYTPPPAHTLHTLPSNTHSCTHTHTVPKNKYKCLLSFFSTSLQFLNLSNPTKQISTASCRHATPISPTHRQPKATSTSCSLDFVFISFTLHSRSCWLSSKAVMD